MNSDEHGFNAKKLEPQRHGGTEVNRETHERRKDFLPLLAKRGEGRGEESQSLGNLTCFKSGGTNLCSAAFSITRTQPDLC